MAWIATLLGAIGVAALVVQQRGTREPTTGPAVSPDVPTVDGKALVFSESFRERANLVMTPVELAPLVPTLRVVGTVGFDPAHVAAVGVRIPGLVRKLNRLEGDRVRKDEVLAEVESADLGEAQASLSVATAHEAAAKTNERRERELASRGLTTARERELATATSDAQRALVDAARQRVTAMTGGTRAPFGTLLIRSPLDGTVVERHVHAGQSVDAHLVAFRVADLDRLWVELTVFEGSVDSIRKGDVVSLSRTGTPEAPIPGSVAYVGEVVDPSNRTAEVRVAVDNREHRLRPGQSVTATIRASGFARTMLRVPTTAITYIDGKATVFRADGENRVVPVQVELGPEDGQHQGIVSGLEAGQIVVSQGVFALKSELFR